MSDWYAHQHVAAVAPVQPRRVVMVMGVFAGTVTTDARYTVAIGPPDDAHRPNATAIDPPAHVASNPTSADIPPEHPSCAPTWMRSFPVLLDTTVLLMS